MQKVLAIAIGAVLVVFCLLAWIGSEAHYRSCLTEAELRHPVAAHWMPGNLEEGEGIGGPPSAPGPPESPHFAFYGQRDRDAALDQCSHWPF
jgi:hypothetical protein